MSTDAGKVITEAFDAGEGILRLAPAWVPRSFLQPGQRLKLAVEDLYALGAHRGGIDERWFSSTTAAANEETKNQPVLFIESDEHSADAGMITRCEAFLDSLPAAEKRVEAGRHFVPKSIDKGSKRIVLVPNMSPHAFALAAAFQSAGMPAEVLPHPSEGPLFPSVQAPRVETDLGAVCIEDRRACEPGEQSRTPRQRLAQAGLSRPPRSGHQCQTRQGRGSVRTYHGGGASSQRSDPRPRRRRTCRPWRSPFL